MHVVITLFVLLLTSLPCAARVWSARWIAVPGAPPEAAGVYHFRRTFDLAARPARFPVHVSADNRYQLFLNGERVALGPARGDLFHWRYETVDLAPRLKAGRNVLAAVVWNWGEHRPLSQISARTAFVLDGDTAAESAVNTGTDWKCFRNPAYSVLPLKREEIRYQYYVAAPGEQLRAADHPWGWESPEFNDSSWQPAEIITGACSRDWTKNEVPGDCHGPWLLVPRNIPPMESKPERLGSLRQASGVEPPAGFPGRSRPVTIPANTRARLLLDNERVTTAYSEFVLSGGAGARFSVRYAESLWVPGTNKKANRDDVEGKEFRGLRDVFLPDGGRVRTFRPLWWRTYRYIELDIETAADILTIDDIRATFTAYPFERKATFASDGPPDLTRILEVGWWTNRLSANEIYQDAYYEQMQYVADTRIESLASVFETGDARLMRNAIEQLDSTRTADGLTYSRAPSSLYQYTPTFSLLWIGMLHDYWRYVDDPEFVRSMLPGVRSVLGWFARQQREDGTLAQLPYYNFLDSGRKWDGHALGPYELHLLQGYQWAADLESVLGSPDRARDDIAAAAKLKASLQRVYWDAGRGLYADDAAHTVFSQHANALAVLTGVAEGTVARDVMERTVSDAKLEQATIYFRYYVHEALAKAGLGDRYLAMLGPWRKLLALGVTTWPETDADESRSDCHGWGDHPNFEMYRTVLGIDSAGPGFSRVYIRPALGTLTRASGAIPHPRGELRVRYSLNAGSLDAEVVTPVAGYFEWRGIRRELPAGTSRFTIQPRERAARARGSQRR
ncbi:MAG TPA: alpha-L-rhamnosidase C-terminal domain-containing protein [Bryobacteraceae bacterium]|nr:alpha-L-rhamnosidase C-terminal domain-containing protein [Bryobacteraceae bacterium]